MGLFDWFKPKSGGTSTKSEPASGNGYLAELCREFSLRRSPPEILGVAQVLMGSWWAGQVGDHQLIASELDQTLIALYVGEFEEACDLYLGRIDDPQVLSSVSSDARLDRHPPLADTPLARNFVLNGGEATDPRLVQPEVQAGLMALPSFVREIMFYTRCVELCIDVRQPPTIDQVREAIGIAGRLVELTS